MKKAFKKAMEAQRETAKSTLGEATNYMGADVTVYESIDPICDDRVCRI